jgi:type IV pilus assembly protein PilY1
MNTILSALLVLVIASMSGQPSVVTAQTITDYTAYPPFISQTVPPLVMIAMSKDHRMFFKAYTDVMDLDNDGTIDTTYKDTINYYGYFDSNKCYTYSTTNGRFEPAVAATGANNHFCSGQWSGNFLNWATMARIDVVRKVLYGGKRSVDTGGSSATTVLQRTLLPRDNHAWVKAYNGPNIGSLTPNAWASISFCNFNSASTETHPLVWIMNGYFPYAASTEVKQCVNQYNGGPALSPTYQYNVEVQVCVAGMLESNCERYFNSGTSVATYKPVGLIQRQGINTQGTDATTDDVILMKFALLTGSFAKNFSGGVLRSNIVDVNNEINSSDGTIKTSTSKIIKNIDGFKIIGYNYSTGNYNIGGAEGSCTTTTPTDGTCMSWGNPIAEIYYEAIRFFKGLTTATSQFVGSPADYTGAPLTVESTWTDPYSACPYCSKPFVLLFSDTYPSFDSDQIPGSYWYSAISTSDTPSVQTLINNSGINSLEGVSTAFVGQSGSVFDKACTAKSINFGSIRGLCIEEPNKQGSYYIAGLAHYARTTDLRSDKTGTQSITTYSVATNSPIPTLEFAVGGKKVALVPIFHDGCPAPTGWAGCTSQGQYGDDTKGSLADFKYCDNDADWTTEQGNGFTSCFDIMWDDAEYGMDFDLDIRYRIYVKDDGSSQITVKTKGIYANSGHTNYAGYFITGVSATGDYLEIRCGGTLAGSTDCDRATDGNETAVNTRTFTVTGTLSGVLKTPLWYAAKYGGFTDKDGTNTPNLPEEWDKDGDGTPDTYFYAANPLQLEAQLAAAFASILNRASSGTAASVLASSTTGEGALYQSFFFPTQFEGTREIKWTGYTQGLFVDAFGNLREDTNGDGRLVYTDDNIIVTRYDTASTSVKVDRYVDVDGNGKADSTTPTATVTLTEVKPIWEAGKRLAQTAPTSRNILTWTDTNGNGVVESGEFITFSTSNSTTLAPYLRADASGKYTANNIINFIRGEQISGLRDRQLTVSGTLQVWKLGDPVYATPVIVGAPRERYDVIYGDASYTDYFVKYRNRRQVAYVGANDGMLHAFNVGFYHRGDDPATTTKTEHGYFTETPTGNTNTPPVFGNELWSFIPQELLPHLRWLAQPDYTHVYYVDLKPKVTDARIFTPDADHPNGWGTILIGGFRMGGSCGNCSTQAKPMAVTADFGSGTQTRTFYSAYFVLDITNPEVNPKLLWVFSSVDLGLTTSLPAVVRVNPVSSGKTDNTNAKWFVVFGSGPTNYDAGINQLAKVFVVNLATGPTASNPAITFNVGSWNSFTGDIISVDRNLDYRVDVAYFGRVINDGSLPWRGKLYRLTTGCATGAGTCPTDPNQWGIPSGSSRVPTEILDTFVDGGGTTRELGPIVAAPVAAIDDSNRVWVFAGTGRYYSAADKADTATQYLVGVKDSVLSGTCSGGETSATSCLDNDLVDLSSAQICVVSVGTCSLSNQVTGVAGVSTYPSLIALVQSKKGWFTTLPGTGERMVATPAVLGGIVFFPTFVPDSDVCIANGTSYLYALYYVTGGAYSEAVIGTTASGANQMVNRSTSLGQGLATTVALHIGAQGNGGAGGGSRSGLTGCSQSSTGALNCVNVNPAMGTTSRYLSWINQRD